MNNYFYGGLRATYRRTLSVWLLSSAGLSGCATNLEAVRAFAKTLAATADYQQVVMDYVESFNRQNAYQPES